MLRSVAIGCLAVGSLLVPLSSLEAQNGNRPNIVFMMADNLGYGGVGIYGGGELRGAPTPRIDKLAAEGLRLTHFLVEPACTPSRAATMTGRYSIRSGLSLVLIPGTPNTLHPEEVSLGEIMKSAGYSTAYYGKWHLGVENSSLPHSQGFDEFWGIPNTTDEGKSGAWVEFDGRSVEASLRSSSMVPPNTRKSSSPAFVPPGPAGRLITRTRAPRLSKKLFNLLRACWTPSFNVTWESKTR